MGRLPRFVSRIRARSRSTCTHDVDPTGWLEVGPLLDPSLVDVSGLGPGGASVGRAFKVGGLPGSVTDSCLVLARDDLGVVRPLDAPSQDFGILDTAELGGLQMQPVWLQVLRAGARTGRCGDDPVDRGAGERG